MKNEETYLDQLSKLMKSVGEDPTIPAGDKRKALEALDKAQRYIEPYSA